MKFRTLLAILLMVVAFAQGQQRSQSIVFINGQKYYVHTVAEGETLYSLSKLYDVTTTQIEQSNSSIEQGGLRVAENIKIPINDPLTPQKKVLDKRARKSFDIHEVQRGETLYAISRKHELSIATIVEDNPDIDPSRLSLGQEILIRKKEVGKSSEAEIFEELTEYKESLNRVAPEGYEYHVVKPKETLYSLLRNTSMSQKEFFEMNDMSSSNLKIGSIVIIRSTQEDDPTQEDNIYDEDGAEGGVVNFRALRGSDTLNISLLLPLTTTSGVVMPIFKEFYQGFMLGIEELKESGRNVNVTLFNSQRNKNTVAEIIATEAFKESDLIVGPVYEELLGDVLRYAQRRSIPVVSPLATLKDSNSGVLFQMAPIAEHKYDKIGSILADSVEVTLIYTDNTDSQYEAEVKELLGTKSYHTHRYEYEHPSVVAERVQVANRLNREVEPSPSDLSPIISGDKIATIFIMSDNETDVDRVLSAVASAEIGLRSRSLKVCDFTVINNSKWNRYDNIDRAVMFRDRVTAFTSYHAKRDSGVIKRFDSRYAKEFSELPSLYSYRGYDVAKIFGEGAYSDIEYGMEGRTFTPLQTTYRFQKIRGKESRANQNWMRVNYKNDFTISIE
ncbi:MAG: LysM peptidoglycan-binding domain-containing protein [Rikenellaceae bacterium]